MKALCCLAIESGCLKWQLKEEEFEKFACLFFEVFISNLELFVDCREYENVTKVFKSSKKSRKFTLTNKSL